MNKHPPTLVACKQPRLRPITSNNPRPVGCHSPQAVHHGFAVALQSWRVVAALRSRPTRQPITSSNPRPVGCHSPQAVHHGFAVALQSWRVVAALRSRPTRRPITSGNPRPVGCHSPQAVHHGFTVKWLMILQHPERRYAAAPCREGLEAASLPRSICSQPPRLCSRPYLVLKVLTIYLNFTFAHNPELVSSLSSVRGARPCAQNCCKQPENRTLHVRI